MPDLKISAALAANPATALDGTEGIPCVQGGASKALTPAQISAYVTAGYSPDRPPTAGVFANGTDEFVGGFGLTWRKFNDGAGLSATAEYDTARFYEATGEVSRNARGYLVDVPPSGDYRIYAKFCNLNVDRSNYFGFAQVGLILPVGGTESSPTSWEGIRMLLGSTLDHVGGGGYAGGAAVSRQTGKLYGEFSTVLQWIYYSWLYTAATKVVTSYYSCTGYDWTLLYNMTLASAPLASGLWLDAASTTQLPAVRLAWYRTLTNAAGLAGQCGA